MSVVAAGQPAHLRAALGPWGRLAKLDALASTVLLVVVGFLILAPVIMLVWGSFRTGSPFLHTSYSLEGYRTTLLSRGTWDLAWTTLWLAVVRTVISVALALFLAWAVHRTNMPGRFWIDKLIYVRFFIPGLPILLAWMLLFAPRSGLLNRIGTDFLGMGGPIFNVYSYEGIIFSSVLGWSSFLYIFVSPAFQRLDATLEESSAVAGAGPITTLRRVTLPLLRPTLLALSLLAFIRMIESFENELFLGAPAGIWVFTTRIFDAMNREPPSYSGAMAISVFLLVLAATLVILQMKLVGSRQHTTVSGKAFKPNPMDLGRARWLVFAAVVFYLFLDVALPLGALVLGTFMNVAGSFEAGFSTRNWEFVLRERSFLGTLQNTLFIAVVSASAAVVLTLLSSYVIVRTRYAGRGALELITWLPWVVPGLVLSLGLFWTYLSIPFTRVLYGSIWLMVLVHITRAFPIGTRIINSNMVQISSELEESSRVAGAGFLRTIVRIFVPLIAPAILASWLLHFVAAVRELNSVILLYGPESQVLSTAIYAFTTTGKLEVSIVYGLIQAFLVAAVFILLVLVRRFLRAPGLNMTF